MPSLNSALFAALSLPLIKLAHGQIFTVNCQPLTIHRGDPIISPGTISAHVHAVIGGTAFQQTMGLDTAVNAKDTTCDKKIDKSNYWQPQLYHQRTDGSFELIHFQGTAVYYLNRACDYEEGRTQCDPDFTPIAPPAGMRMVTGNPMRRTIDESLFEHQAMQHVAYPAIGAYDSGVCPESHPKAIFSLFYEFFYDTSPFTDFNKWVYAMGDPTGYGLHGDFINGWDQAALENSIQTCSGPDGAYSPDCSINKNAGSATSVDPEVAPPTEEVGLNGPIPTLPGNNPVTGTPIKKRFSLAGRVKL
ncbi:hypothetical protein O988_00501 [Pseudogymnoascus sp. VKM F-3808]|nr:hypothetical protein V490_07026 [Pseudogymnoascus sp. VKM F-3557]KFY04809.1 hypothetical protein O988_00501 [Pseudogymnoascus sp. VKM F-3808]